MKFADKFPQAKPGDEPEDMIVLERGFATCRCGYSTYFRDYAWGVSVATCSEECREAFWKGFQAAEAPGKIPDTAHLRAEWERRRKEQEADESWVDPGFVQLQYLEDTPENRANNQKRFQDFQSLSAQTYRLEEHDPTAPKATEFEVVRLCSYPAPETLMQFTPQSQEKAP